MDSAVVLGYILAEVLFLALALGIYLIGIKKKNRSLKVLGVAIFILIIIKDISIYLN